MRVHIYKGDGKARAIIVEPPRGRRLPPVVFLDRDPGDLLTAVTAELKRLLPLTQPVLLGLE